MSSKLQAPGQRIAVVGVTASGKTTTAAHLARILHIPHVELDALHWQPGWQPLDLEPFRALVAEAVARSAWVTDGNYSKVHDLILERADTLVWLDYSLLVIFYHLTYRTLKRIYTKEVLWNTNRETWRGAFFSRDSLFVWAIQSYPKLKERYARLHENPRYANIQIIRLRSPRQTNAWLAWLADRAPQVHTE